MDHLVLVLVPLKAGVSSLEFYRGRFGHSTGTTNPKPKVVVTVDRDKVRQDEDKAKERVPRFGSRVNVITDVAADSANKAAPRAVKRQAAGAVPSCSSASRLAASFFLDPPSPVARRMV